MRRSGHPKKPDSRLPPWTWGPILGGGILAYLGVGALLLGNRFGPDFDSLWLSSQDVTRSQAEAFAPYVLLLVPAILGAIWTRDTVRLIFQGLRRGDPPTVIAKDVALFALSAVVLILVALTTSSRPHDH